MKNVTITIGFFVISEQLGGATAGRRRRRFDEKLLGKPPNWLKSGSDPRGQRFDEKPLPRQRDLPIQGRDSRHCISMKNDWKYSEISMFR